MVCFGVSHDALYRTFTILPTGPWTQFSSALSDNCTESTPGHFLPLPYEVEDRLIEHFLFASRNSFYGNLVWTSQGLALHLLGITE